MTRRFVVVLPLSPLNVGDSFSLSRWPLHVTIVPAFTTDAPVGAIARVLRTVGADEPPVAATVGAAALFGPRENIAVDLVAAGIRLPALHRRLLAALEPLCITADRPAYSGPGYSPHVTATRRERADAGAPLLLAQLALVDMERDAVTGGRGIVATAGLGTP